MQHPESTTVRMPRISAGLLMYRIQDAKLQVLLAHPGGPYFKNKDGCSVQPQAHLSFLSLAATFHSWIVPL